MKRLFVILQALALSAGLFAQNSNLNPTVQVTNAYENNMKDFERVPLKAEIPDSLYEFDLNFDYSGFEKPYKGNDEFNPFLTELDLVARPYDGKNFYLKAGAGYTLHPQFDLSWVIPSKGRFKSGLFVNHRSYFGNYVSDISAPETFTGADSYSKAGFEGRADWDRSWLQTAVWYDGVYSKAKWDQTNSRNYNSGSVMLRIASRDFRDEYAFKYDIRLEDSFGTSKRLVESLAASPSGGLSLTGRINENVFDGSVMLGYQAGRSFFGLASDINAVFGSNAYEMKPSGPAWSDKDWDYSGFAVALRPQYRFIGEVITLEAGVSMLITGGRNIYNSVTSEGKEEKFNVWPFVKFNWNAVPDKFIIFADADLGGSVAGERSAWKESHLSVDYQISVIKKSVADLGFKGTLGKKMQWKLGAGYENLRNANVFEVDSGMPCLSRLAKLEDFNFFLDVDARFGIFSLDADVCYRSFLHKEEYDTLPSAFTAGLRGTFDIRSRASVYAGCDFRSSRKAGAAYTAPAYVDLYAGADFRLTRKLGLFIEGRNLLNRKLQIVPGISEKGFVLTGGIVLNF